MEFCTSESALPSVTSLYSDSEELRQWREKLKEEVEEDIEHQVRMRLKSDEHNVVKYPSNHHEANIFRYERKHTSKCKWNSPVLRDHSHPVKLIISKNSANISEHVKHLEITSSTKKHPLQMKQVRIARKVRAKDELVCSKNGIIDEPTSCEGTSFVSGPDLTGVYQYVHTKYGCPSSQLSLIATSKSFKTRSVDSSGCGHGPIINFPIESKICQPTPKHFISPPASSSNSPHVGRNCSTEANKSNEGQSSVSHVSNKICRSNEGSSGREHAPTESERLEFESKFESGNLWKTSQIGLREYRIWMSPDLYSKRHTQWFYFRIKGMSAAQPYKFHIVNFMKPDSLYNQGMQPLLYSEELMATEQQGWKRVGDNVSYHKTEGNHSTSTESFYTLTWTMEFPHTNDTCYLAYCFPYSYSQLLRHLEAIGNCPHRAKYFSQRELCQTLAGNVCPLLTISNGADNKKFPGIIITARVHPGETNSSWVMEGLLNYILSNSQHAQELRNNYVFKVVPMLNPDGVIVGNYRTSLAGVDLNRVYTHPEHTLFPTIYHTKKLISDFKKEREVLLYVDLHGHSRKHNVFTYGCHSPHSDHMTLLKEHVLPFLLAQQNPAMFDYRSCKFDMQHCKEATGRVVAWRMGVLNSFTLESTFCGSSFTETKKQFSINDLKDVGESLGEAIHSFHCFFQNEKYKNRVLSEIAADLVLTVSKRRNNMMEKVSSVRASQHQVVSSPSESSTPGDAFIPGETSLQKYFKTDMSHLEDESSTSGSDSENDTFSWKPVKNTKKKKVVMTRVDKSSSSHSSTAQTKERSAEPRGTLLPTKSVTKDHFKLPHIKTTKHMNHHQPSAETSQPLKLPAAYKFVSKYQDRSNGGIPIFSEERIKERRDKKLLLSQDTTSCTDNSLSKLNSKEKPEQQSLWTLSKRIDKLREYSIAEEKAQIRILSDYYNQKLIQRKGRTLRMEHFKVSPELTKFIKDSWKL